MANKIDGLVSLLKTGNLVIIDMLIESHCVNDEMLLSALQRLYPRKYMKNIDLFWMLANYLEGIIDKETLDKLFFNFVSAYPGNKCHEKFSPCFMKLCDMGAQSEIWYDIINVTADLFFYHLSKNEPFSDIYTIKRGICDNIDDKICHWIFGYFMSVHQNYNNNDVCGVVITAYYKKDKSYFEKLMQIVYDRKLNDIVMLNILSNNTFIDNYNMKYILDCDFCDEIIFLDRLRQSSTKSLPKNNDDLNKLRSFWTSNSNAMKIYEKLEYRSVYDENFDEYVNDIVTLMEMFQTDEF
uniref:Uncharacterized protein n=1 Tax=viral metagenome TaxID=1070528 RepID=A0A6C0C8G6_9ZZZZ